MISEDVKGRFEKRVAAIIVAAGQGERVGGTIPKQFRLLQGKRVVDWSIETCLKHHAIAQTVVALPSGWLSVIEKEWQGRTSLRFIEGSETRAESVKSGLKCLKEIDYVLIHDAARPGLNDGIIDAVLAKLDKFDGIAPVLQITDTLKRVRDGLISTVDRSEYVRTQTPQGFNLEILRKSLRMSKSNYTDELQVLEENGARIEFVPGQKRLTKLTHTEDIENFRFVLGSNT